MIVVATHRRPKSMERFIHAYHDTGASEPVLVLIDNNDLSYGDVTFPDNFRVVLIEPGLSTSSRNNVAFSIFPDEKYYSVMADDVVPLTPRWDAVMKEYAGDWNIAYCADGIQDHRLATHPFIGGELVRAQWFIEVDTGDWYADNARMDIGRSLHLLKYVEEVKFNHLHYSSGGSEIDETYTKQSQDRTKYDLWRRKGFYEDTARIALARESWLSKHRDKKD